MILKAQSLSGFLQEIEKDQKKSQECGKQLVTKFYAAIRGLKELSLTEAWFKVKGGFNGNTTKKKGRKLNQIYLLPHVLSGHLFSLHYGESASIPKLSSIFVSRYFQKDDLGWRTDDSTRMNPSFICFFVDKMTNIFNVILGNDTLLEAVTVTHEKGSFNIEIPSSVIKNTNNPLGISELLQMYIGKLRENEDIPIEDESVKSKIPNLQIQNLPLKSITVMVDENSLNSVVAFYIKEGDCDSQKINLQYLSNVFSIPQSFFAKVIRFLANEVSDDLYKEEEKEKKDKTLSAQLAATTLWPEFASSVTTEETLEEGEKEKNEEEEISSTSSQFLRSQQNYLRKLRTF